MPAPSSANAKPSDTFDANSGESLSGAQIWQAVDGRLRKVLGDRVHMSWTGQLKLQLVDAENVYLTTPSKFVARRIDERYGDLVQKIWSEFGPQRVCIDAANAVKANRGPKRQTGLISGPSSHAKMTGAMANGQKTTQSLSGPGHAGTEWAGTERAGQAQSGMQIGGPVHRKQFTFENFVVGPSNELAFAVARRVAHSREGQYNPIVIHGPHGMGKTHLLHAVKTEALKTDPSRRVRLISSEEFVASFVSSVRAQGRSEIEAFKSSLRDVDLLIIDDAHFIADKPGSQEELMHTLISLVECGKQILLASDRHPHEIGQASPRLKSYLCGGLLCDIGSADYELRRRILDRLIEGRRQSGHTALTMPQDARDHLAARINATPRDLEGALNQVVARLEFLGKPLTLDSIQEALAHSRFGARARPTIDSIQRAAAKHFNISLDELLSKRRARAIARPRQIAMYLSKKLTTRSLPDIGRRFGGRDHTTVIHAIKRIEALKAEDASINADVDALMKSLTGA